MIGDDDALHAWVAPALVMVRAPAAPALAFIRFPVRTAPGSELLGPPGRAHGRSTVTMISAAGSDARAGRLVVAAAAGSADEGGRR